MNKEDLEELSKIIELALSEDIRSGDITTQAVYKGNEEGRARFIAKQDGVLAGVRVAELVATTLDPGLKFNALMQDGARIQHGDVIATIEGSAGTILSAERTMLNFMQRMSGIATQVRRYMDIISNTKAVVLDTRKTVPGNRIIDKWAVSIGGGQNHRHGLYDRYLIKENHIRVAGSIEKAIQSCVDHRNASENAPREIEIEVTNLDEFVLASSFEAVTYIMLDNMSPEMMYEAVKLNNGHKVLEASGNVSEETILSIAETGVDQISIGAITHSVKAVDISLLFDH